MSSHDFGLLSAPPIHDHFPSAFMHGYHHHSSYGHDRFPSGTGYDRFLHSDSTFREPYNLERRQSEPLPTLRPNYTLHRQSTIPTISSPFDYTHTTSISTQPTSVVRRDNAVAVEPVTTLRPIVDFDPRPPHAGWTPKEETDEEVYSRELLNDTSLGAEARSPGDLHLGYMSNNAIPRDESLSPGNSVSGQPSSPNSASKTYSFVSLPGNAIRKRPRRRYDEIERLYACSWPDCTKAYGTLNHLNAHVSMQRHGSKRSPAEFKELRKQWRQQKKQESLTGPIRGVDMDPYLRRRRATEPNLAINRTMLSVGSNQSQVGMPHRLPISGNIHYNTRSIEEENAALGVSPTSTSSDNMSFWQDPPVSPGEQQQRAGLIYSMTMAPPPHAESSSPLSSQDHLMAGVSPPMNRLPPDSTLLTPLPGYRPPSPHNLMTVSPTMNRLPPDSTLLTPLSGYRPPSPHIRMSPSHGMVQSLTQTNMPSLSPSQQSHGSFDEYQGARSGQA